MDFIGRNQWRSENRIIFTQTLEKSWVSVTPMLYYVYGEES